MANKEEEFGSILDDNPDRITLLDRALEDATPAQKARVRAVVRRLDIDDENEFYIVVIAIGYLIILVKDAPEQWQQLFDAFEAKLDEWSEQNLRTLAAIHQQGAAAERMSQNFLRLSNSIKLSTTKTGEFQNNLIALNKTLARLNNSLGEVKTESKTNLSKVKTLSDKFDQTETELADVATQMSWIWGINFGLSVCVFGLCIMFGWNILRQQSVIKEQNERLGWLLEKANRQECVTGIKPAGDPQCLQFQ